MAARSIFFSRLFILVLSLYSDVELRTVSAEQKTWCVAKPSSTRQELLNNMDYACSNVDCSIITQGFPCFTPDTVINHASVVMNLYYQANGRNTWNCYFNDSGLITMTDPSYDNCTYKAMEIERRKLRENGLY